MAKTKLPKTTSPEEALDLNAALAEAKPVEPGELPVQPPGETIPDINSVEWTPFVLSKMTEDELFEGLPTIEGLRRITNIYIGDVVESLTTICQSPNVSNGHHACAVHTLTVNGYNGQTRRISGAADVFEGNGDDAGYSWRYAAATCETRAESRAYRRLLRLRHVCTAEEVSQVPEDQSGMSGLITSRQKAFIDMICKRCNIDAFAFINKGKGRYEHIDKVPYDTARIMSAKLNQYQSNPKEIPEDVRGFKSNWMGS